MAASPPKTFSVSCPKCGVSFVIGTPLAGKPGKCGKCGHVFKLPLGPTPPKLKAEAPAEAKPPQPAVAQPEFIGVTCHVCGTRMFGRPEQVGQMLRCPDCHAKTELRPPEAKAQANIPAAMEGEQYELWDVDEAPLPAQLIAAQPKYITVECRLCQTLLYAAEDQVGKTLVCPDCRTPNVVPPPAEPARSKFVLTPDKEVYKVDPKSHPGERPAHQPIDTRGMLYEQERKAEFARQAASGKIGTRFDVRGHPIMPRWPLVTGIVPFLFSRGAPVRWFSLAAAGMLTGSIAITGLRTIGSGGGMVAGGLSAISGVCLMAAGGVIAVIVLAAASSIFISIVTESTEGNDHMQRWPSLNIGDWLPDTMYVFLAAFVSPFPGWAVSQFAAHDSLQAALWICGSLLVFFPIVLLSQLVISSPFAILSARVLASFVHCPISWFVFYVQLALLAAACVAATYYVALLSEWSVILLPPLYVAAFLLAARLLGRLGWVLAESMPEIDADDATSRR